MKISVVIPVYNAEKFLKRCLDSVLRQTIYEKEIICVDDGSTDHSLEILNKYAKEYDNIHIITQRNQYAGVARNNGALMAKGEYIHFLDADDYLIDDIYSTIYELAKKNNADYVKTRNIAFDMTSGEHIENESYSLKNWDLCYFNRRISLKECPDILLRTSVTPWSAWVKRDYIEKEKIRFNDLRCVNDRSFYIEAICNTDNIVISDNYVVAHQVNNHESLVGTRNSHYECFIKSYNIIREKILEYDSALRIKVMTEELRGIALVYSWQTELEKTENENILKSFFETFDWMEVDRELLLDDLMYDIYQRLQIHIWDIFDAQLSINSLDELKKIFLETNNIVIYGAGSVCEKLIEYALTNQCNGINCIVVSQAEGNREYINGIPVKEKSREVLNQAQLIIIATLENVHLSIYRTLVHMGNYNIKAISGGLYKEILNAERNNNEDFIL